MSGKKNPPTTAIVERAGNEETAALQGAANSCSHSNIDQARPQGSISRFLLYGQENAVPLRQLVTWTGLDGRTVRRMIESERRAGVPILSDNTRGYFLPESEDETVRFIKSMKHRANEIMKSVATIEQRVNGR